MHPNSSISSSSDLAVAGSRGRAFGARDYVLTVFAGTLAVLLGMAGLIVGTRTLGREPLAYAALVEYQEMKLTHPSPDTLFLGDSSLGNAIDAGLWRELTGRSAENLALTGFFGYAGTYNFLRRELDNGRPRNIVVMHTPDMMTRPFSDDGYVMTAKPGDVGLAERAGLAWRLVMNPAELHESILWAARAILHPDHAAREHFTGAIKNDYIEQGDPIALAPDAPGFTPGDINPGKIVYLERIAALCRAEGLNCVYAHGPLAQPLCDKSRAYFARVAELVRGAGLTLVSEQPVCVPTAQIGDSYDHVRPAFKRAYTERYRALLAPFLR